MIWVKTMNKEDKTLRTISDGQIMIRLLRYMKGHVFFWQIWICFSKSTPQIR